MVWHTIHTYVALAAPVPANHEIGCLQFTITGEAGEWFCHVMHITKKAVEANGGKPPAPIMIAEEIGSLDDAKRMCEEFAVDWLAKTSAQPT